MDSEPEDIFSTSLETLYQYTPIAHSSAGSLFTHTTKTTSRSPITVTLRTPDTLPANWSLHASSIWVSSLYIADNLADLSLDQRQTTTRVLELGAGRLFPLRGWTCWVHLCIVSSS
jgi:EEF1A N-terminal glycine/lysine methyltransferase